MVKQISFLGIINTDANVKDTARKIMEEHPETYASDRLFFDRLFREFIPDWEELNVRSRQAITELCEKDWIRRRQELREKDGKQIPKTKEKKEDVTYDFEEAISLVSR